MKWNDILHRRQYKICLSNTTQILNLNSLKHMGIWSNPTDYHYILTLKDNNDPNFDPVIFEKNFKEETGLNLDEFKIESSYGPLTLQSAVEFSWF